MTMIVAYHSVVFCVAFFLCIEIRANPLKPLKNRGLLAVCLFQFVPVHPIAMQRAEQSRDCTATKLLAEVDGVPNVCII
jgi:hypothetical protein